MNYGWLVLGALLLGGCATARVLKAPDGTEIHAITCDGFGASIQTCREKAVAICSPRNYTVVGQQDAALAYGVVASGTQAGTRTMTIRCNNTPILPISPQ